MRADERFRARYGPTKVRGSDGCTMYGSKLETERDLFKHLDNPDLEHRPPLYYDAAAKKPFTFTTENARVSMQIEILTAL